MPSSIIMAAASPIPSQPMEGSHPTALEEDPQFKKWNDSCAEVPTWISLEKRMVQVGTLVGLDGRRRMWSFLTRTSDAEFQDEMNAFQKDLDFETYSSTILSVQRSSGKRDLDSNELPLPKKRTDRPDLHGTLRYMVQKTNEKSKRTAAYPNGLV
jgi:hypothetical protein